MTLTKCSLSLLTTTWPWPNYCSCGPGSTGLTCDPGQNICSVANPCANSGTCSVQDGAPDCSCPESKSLTCCCLHMLTSRILVRWRKITYFLVVLARRTLIFVLDVTYMCYLTARTQYVFINYLYSKFWLWRHVIGVFCRILWRLVWEHTWLL